MAKVETVVIKSHVGDYAPGDTLTGKDAKAFLDGTPMAGSYHLVTADDSKAAVAASTVTENK